MKMLSWFKKMMRRKNPAIKEVRVERKVKEAEFMVLPLGTRFRIVEKDGIYRIDDFNMWDTNGLGDMAFRLETTETTRSAYYSMVIARRLPEGVNPRMFVPIRDIRVLSA